MTATESRYREALLMIYDVLNSEADDAVMSAVEHGLGEDYPPNKEEDDV